MNGQFKILDMTQKLVFFMIASLFLISANSAHARFIKKIVVEPILNPQDWQETFDPGAAFTLMLKNSLAKSGKFQLLQPSKVTIKKRVSSLFKNQKIVEGENQKVVEGENQKVVEKENQEFRKEERIERVDLSEQISSPQSPSSQYQIRGHILIFNPDINPIKSTQLKNEGLRHKETAEVRADIELINLRTGRSLAKKSFGFTSDGGRKTFNSKLSALDYEALEFKSSSIGKALWKLNNSTKDFIVQILNDVPLEGDLISVDNKNKSAVINLGKANGIMVQDVFTVFSMKTGFIDPLNQTDLGEKYTRKGVIKIIEVQGRFSRAEIMAGQEFSPGDLVVPKHRKFKKYKLEGQSSEKNIVWGAYKGLPSLSY